jgi:hypothetical protein
MMPHIKTESNSYTSIIAYYQMGDILLRRTVRQPKDHIRHYGPERYHASCIIIENIPPGGAISMTTLQRKVTRLLRFMDRDSADYRDTWIAAYDYDWIVMEMISYGLISH